MTTTSSGNTTEDLIFSTSHIAAAPNKAPRTLDWNKSHGLVAIASGKSIALLDVTSRRILTTLHGHSSPVNSIVWINSTDSRDLLSSSIDGSIKHWRVDTALVNSQPPRTAPSSNSSSPPWILVSTIYSDPKAIINRITAVVCPLTGGNWIASGDEHGVIRTWKSDGSDAWIAQPIIDIHQKAGYMMLSVAITFLSQSQPVLIAAPTAPGKLLVHTWSKSKGGFEYSFNLPGHSEWIRDLSWAPTPSDPKATRLLASASQDKFVRLWGFTSSDKPGKANEGEKVVRFGRQRHLVLIESIDTETPSSWWDVSSYSVLAGHEDWVMSVSWRADGSALATASIDKSVALWSPDPDSGLWISEVRVGGVGGTQWFGCYGAVWDPTGHAVLSHAHNGALSLWEAPEPRTQAPSGAWIEAPCPSGHDGDVTDAAWSSTSDPNAYLVSVSSDQTARVWAPWNTGAGAGSWHEVNRSQIHGYDFGVLAFLPSRPHYYASAGEEKVIRIFDAPATWLTSLDDITGITREHDERTALAANVPPLGLSNKPLTAENMDDVSPHADASHGSLEAGRDEAPRFKPVALTTPPFEDILLENTLWPEVGKLYGHGYDVYALAASKDGSLLASTCKAQSAKHAVIRLWDTSSWKEVAVLSGHTLTVTSLSWSSAGQLLSVGRDRTWHVWASSGEELGTHKGHDRIIWSGDWAADASCWATGSRDKKVKVWDAAKIDKGSEALRATWDAKTPVTAVAWAPRSNTMLSVGLETGAIRILRQSQDGEAGWKLDVVFSFPDWMRPSAQVNRLTWRDPAEDTGDSLHGASLAVAGADRILRVFTVV